MPLPIRSALFAAWTLAAAECGRGAGAAPTPGVNVVRPEVAGPRGATSPPPAVPALPQSDVLYASANSGYASADRRVIRDAAAWAAAWQQLHGGAAAEPAPAVDFARQGVALVALGERPTGGHTVRVDGVTSAGGATVVHVTERAPGAGCMSLQVITAPAVAARVPLGTGAVRFDVRRETTSC